jgi:hypothetical protein
VEGRKGITVFTGPGITLHERLKADKPVFRKPEIRGLSAYCSVTAYKNAGEKAQRRAENKNVRGKASLAAGMNGFAGNGGGSENERENHARNFRREWEFPRRTQVIRDGHAKSGRYKRNFHYQPSTYYISAKKSGLIE